MHTTLRITRFTRYFLHDQKTQLIVGIYADRVSRNPIILPITKFANASQIHTCRRTSYSSCIIRSTNTSLCQSKSIRMLYSKAFWDTERRTAYI